MTAKHTPQPAPLADLSLSFGGLPYRLLAPEFPVPPGLPLVLFLHGAGERGTDNAAQLTQGVGAFLTPEAMREMPCVLVAPQCPVEGWWSGEMLENALALAEQSALEYRCDPGRLYITGLSMGGQGVWKSLALKPFLFAAAVVVCGRADPATAASIAHVPVRVFHGGADQVVPVEQSRAMVEALRLAGADVGYTEYDGVDHGSWVPAYNDIATRRWLFSIRKPA